MELIQAVKQILGGDRAFADADVAQGTLAAEVIDLVRGAVKDEAVKDANDAAKELMSGLEQKEADLTKAAEAAKAEAAAALATEQARMAGVVSAYKPLGLSAEDALGVLCEQKDGAFLSVDAVKDRLIALAGEKNGAVETLDDRRETPVGSAEAEVARALDEAHERRKKNG